MKAVLLLTFVLFYTANCTDPIEVRCTCDKCPLEKNKPGAFSKLLIFCFSILWFVWLFFVFISKVLGEGCDPRVRGVCDDGLSCYRKSDDIEDGMCVPKIIDDENGNRNYINYSKIRSLLKGPPGIT